MSLDQKTCEMAKRGRRCGEEACATGTTKCGASEDDLLDNADDWGELDYAYDPDED